MQRRAGGVDLRLLLRQRLVQAQREVAVTLHDLGTAVGAAELRRPALVVLRAVGLDLLQLRLVAAPQVVGTLQRGQQGVALGFAAFEQGGE